MGIGASHTTLMNTKWAQVDHLQRAHDFKNALLNAQAQLKAAKPDAVVIIGSNHFRGYWLDMMPSFCISVGDVDCAGEHGTPKGNQLTNPALAIELCNSLMASNFDMAFSAKFKVDHGISHAIQWIVGENTVPIIPIVINCFAPPLPSLDRCLDFAEALKKAIAELPEDLRIAVIATGGLSHQLPFPDWRKPASDNDDFLVDSWKHGRNDWTIYEKRRREIIINSPPQLNEEWDRNFLSLMEQGKLNTLPKTIGNKHLTEIAGNGSNEVRAWLIMAALLDNKPSKTLCYSPMPEWLTGMGVALIDPNHN